MTDMTQIKTRADGSIDTAFYMARGRLMRSEAAHDMGRATRRSVARRIAGWIAALPARALSRA